jgi:general secretion pathway protein C
VNGSFSINTLRNLDFGVVTSRLLRRDNIEFLVRAIRLVSIGIIVLTCALVLYMVGSDFLSMRGLEREMEGRLASILAASESSTATTQKDPNVQAIASKNVFGTLGRAPTPAPVTTVAPPSPLNLTLIGTFLTGGQQPYAIIEDKKKQTQDVFVVTQSIFGQATLQKIFEDRVEIERAGKTEILRLDDLGGGSSDSSGGIATAGSDEFVVDETELDKGLENLPLLLTQARAVPYFKEGRSIGLRLFAIKTGSLYEKIGLKNGDILKTINGNSLGDISQALKLFEQLKQERSINLVLEREKQDREFKYQIR